jgi:hypothetical protein
MKKPKEKAIEIHTEIYNSLMDKLNDTDLLYELAIDLSLLQVNQSIQILNELVEYREIQYWGLIKKELTGLKKSPSLI